MSGDGRYPDRMSRGGKPLVIDKAITHYCIMKRIADMKSKIGDDAYDDIENNSQLGVIVKFAGLNFQWAGKHVQYLLGNMLQISKKHEIWVLADGHPLRFSLHEFEHITGLKCGVHDPNDVISDFSGLRKEMCLPTGDGPNWPELEEILGKCKEWSFEKRKMVGLLVVIFVGILGLHRHSRIPVHFVKLVMDPERFECYSWGRVAFTALLNSVPSSFPVASNYTLKGFVHVLVVWALEHIPRLGEMSGGHSVGNIPLLRWATRTSRGLDIEKVFEADKLTAPGNKVRLGKVA